MKHKLLLFGTNKTLMTEFFVHMDGSFEILSCSGRVDDIRAHLKYYTPDAAVLCLADETRDELASLSRIREIMREKDGLLIVVGDGTRCDEFERMMPRAADYVIRRSRGDSSRQLEEQLAARLDAIAGQRRTKVKEKQEAARTSNDSIEEALAAAAAAVEEAVAQAEKKERERRKHVLVVDDDSGMLKMIKEILGDDYDVATAISGKVALKFLESRKTDIVLLDYEMPVQSGAQVYEKILQNPATAHIPVVFLTGVSDRERISEVLAMKPRGYLLKPIDTDRLKKTIAEIVGK